MLAHWPKPLDGDFCRHYGLDDQQLQYVEQRNWLVTQGRNLRQLANIPAGKKINFVLKPARDVSAHDLAAMRLLLNAGRLEIDRDYTPPKGTPAVAGDFAELYLPMEGLIDVAAEKIRTIKELDKVQLEIEKVVRKLNNPAFVEKAPPAVLADHKQRLMDWQSKHAQLKSALDSLCP
jgi:valyl-tRNA synthetase